MDGKDERTKWQTDGQTHITIKSWNVSAQKPINNLAKPQIFVWLTLPFYGAPGELKETLSVFLSLNGEVHLPAHNLSKDKESQSQSRQMEVAC